MRDRGERKRAVAQLELHAKRATGMGVIRTWKLLAAFGRGGRKTVANAANVSSQAT